MGKENTSSGHVADSNTAILCEGSRLIEKSKGHSSHAAFKVSNSPISGLHETSDTRVDQCSTPLSEVCTVHFIFVSANATFLICKNGNFLNITVSSCEASIASGA